MVYVYHDGPDPLPEEAPTNDRRPVHDATGHFTGRYCGSKQWFLYGAITTTTTRLVHCRSNKRSCQLLQGTSPG